MVAPLLAVAANESDRKKNRAARKARKEERSGESGDPRSRGRRNTESYTETNPVTGLEGRRRTLDDARDRARYRNERIRGEAADAYRSGKPYALEDVQLGNTIYKVEKANAERKNAEVEAAKRAVEGMKKGGAVKKRRDGLAQRGKTKGRMC